ncbi:MAG: DNA/RNA non-specific endonuclease [Rikenellaceae bacterium]
MYIKSIFATLFSLMAFCAVQSQSLLPTANGEIVTHTHYTLSYSEHNEQAEWVFYSLTPDMLLTVSASRSDNFREDPKVSTQSATLTDYVGSGYDRGHLCPAASMACSSEAMSESFYMSNMSPQLPAFNRGSWKQLEEHVRNLAVSDSILHVVTGPILNDPIGSIGQSGVTIPRYYYKVLYSPKKDAMIAFLMENTKLSEPLDSYVTTVDEIETLSGINFFAEIDDAVTQQESQIEIEKWQADDYSTTKTESKEQPTTDQCQGKTASGKQCSRKAQKGSAYCWQHQQ